MRIKILIVVTCSSGFMKGNIAVLTKLNYEARFHAYLYYISLFKLRYISAVKVNEPLSDIFCENEFLYHYNLEESLHLTALKILKKKRISFVITAMVRTKRPIELKIV